MFTPQPVYRTTTMDEDETQNLDFESHQSSTHQDRSHKSDPVSKKELHPHETHQQQHHHQQQPQHQQQQQHLSSARLYTGHGDKPKSLIPSTLPASASFIAPYITGTTPSGKIIVDSPYFGLSLSAKKPYKCGTCRKGFAQRGHLINHELGGRKHFFCTFCNKAFSQEIILRNHIRTHTGERPFHCGYCNRTFCQVTEWKNHERTHTGKCQQWPLLFFIYLCSFFFF